MHISVDRIVFKEGNGPGLGGYLSTTHLKRSTVLIVVSRTMPLQFQKMPMS